MASSKLSMLSTASPSDAGSSALTCKVTGTVRNNEIYAMEWSPCGRTGDVAHLAHSCMTPDKSRKNEMNEFRVKPRSLF
jgi:hypothetical protein